MARIIGRRLQIQDGCRSLKTLHRTGPGPGCRMFRAGFGILPAMVVIIAVVGMARSCPAQAIQLFEFPTGNKSEAPPEFLPPPSPTSISVPEVSFLTEDPGEDLSPKPVSIGENDLSLPITLAAALRLADDRPLVIVAAQAQAWAAEARLQRAQVWWVPQLNIGADYVRHDGFGPDFNLGINTPSRPLSQNVNFLYAGGGFINSHETTDMIFMPLAAKQVLKSKRWDIQSAKNDALLATARSYFDVHRARGAYASAVDVVGRGEQLVEELKVLSRDLIPQVEVDRARRLLADLQQEVATARQDWRISSANLTQVLRLDPRVVVEPVEHDHLQITMIDPSRPLDELLPIALTNRPELQSQQALVQETIVRIRQEKLRPLVPSLMLNGFQTPQELIQFGAQGIGGQSKLNWWSFRNDISPQLMWQAEGLGFGNLARVKEQRANQSLNIVELFRVQDAVAADVTRIQAKMQAASVRVVEAERSLRQAIITYNGNYEGLHQTRRFDNVLIQVYRPQEVVIALEHLWDAYTQYFDTVADYNIAQFEMFHALGYPAKEISVRNPPGESAPVDISRPAYLPDVHAGPPPATR